MYNSTQVNKTNEINEIIDTLTTSDADTAKIALNRRRFLQGAALVGAGCALPLVAPGASEAAAAQLFGKPSADQQKKLGQQAAQETLQKYRQVSDKRAAHFEEIGRRLVGGLPKEDQGKWDYKFYVLDSKEVNAFALPGGPMFMFTGLYQLLDTDDALAAVTGHEMTHVRKEHWAKSYAKSQQRQTILGIGLSIFKVGRAGQLGAGVVDQLLTTSFTRSEEDEADAGGLDDLVRAGYNPSGMLSLFRTLEKASGGENKSLAFLSDHPLTSQRIKNTQDRILKMDKSRVYPATSPLNYQSLVS